MGLFDKFAPPIPAPTNTYKPPMAAVFGGGQIAYPEGTVAYQPGEAVAESRDLHRILELPRRPATPVPFDVARLSKGPVVCQCKERFHRRCANTLLPVQGWALAEAAQVQGLLGPIGVGHGKTLLDLLTPMVMPNCKTAVLLVQPNLRDQLLSVDWHFYAQHWHLPNLAASSTGRSGFGYPDRPWLHVVAYSELSGAKSTDLLERIRPDLIIADEGHNLRRREAARTKRFLRYFAAHPETRLCVWSGTLTSKSLKDFAHLSNLALRQGSPTPLHWPTVEEWALALDPSDWPAPIGALAKLCRTGEHVREGFRRRIMETAGVVNSSDADSCGASLVFSQRKVNVPTAVRDALSEIAKTWTRPDGEELVDAFSKARCMREMSCGFYYRWTWPRGESLEVRNAWLAARKAWHKELREKLKHSRAHMDSPLLCAKAAIRWYEGYTYVDPAGNRVRVPPQSRSGPLPVWDAFTWPEWVGVRDSAKPATEAVWVDDFLVKDCADWIAHNAGIVWYEHDAFGRAVAGVSGAPLYGPGDEASRNILGERGERGIVASIRAHGTGKNLQPFCRQLVANPPSDGAIWEQLIGRTHRQGQLADEVTVEVYRHTDDMAGALDKARDLSSYIEGTMGGQMKLLRATYLF